MMKDSQPTKPFSKEICNGVSLQVLIHTQKSIPFTMTIFTVLPKCTTPLDQHLEDECWIILDGIGVLSSIGSRHVTKGEVYFFPSNQTHCIHNNGNVPLKIVSIYWLNAKVEG